MTEGNARDFAGNGTTYGARRWLAAEGTRRRAEFVLPAPQTGAPLLVAALVAALLTLIFWPSPVEVVARHAPVGMTRVTVPSSARLQSLPLAAQAAVSTAIGRGRPAAAARATRFGYALAGGGVQAALARDSVRLSSAGGLVSLALRAVGRDDSMSAVAPAAPNAHANRVTYHHGNVAEWYAAGPLGVEQGFTIARRPSGSAGPLVLSTAARGSLLIRRSGSGLVFTTRSRTVALRYGGLAAADAAGRRLPATLVVRGSRLLIRVDDRHARYPVRIDPFVQEGSKRTGSDASSPHAAFGDTIAVSQDGNTALVGGPGEGAAGAAWVFTNVGGVWTQQGGKLAPNNPSGFSDFGDSVALSTDGNVALIGGFLDTNNGPQAGAAWLFFRSGIGWSQGPKLVPSDAVITPMDHGSFFGFSVALSGDGHTALIGGWGDHDFVGAAWVFSDTSGPWTQKQKLTASDETGAGAFGKAVALSNDGNTALIAGTDGGAVWIFTRSGSTFSQQGLKLTPRDGNPGGGGSFGSAVALSQNGNTALIGGSGDNSQDGAAWIFTRSGANWTQQGAKLTPADETNAPFGGGFGTSVALSADGNTALIGGPSDFNGNGASWVFVRSGSSWSQRGPKITVNTVAGGEQGQGGFGIGVGLSGDGIRALIGGANDNQGFGALWAFDQVPGCADQAGTAPPGGGAVSVTLSCVGPVGQPITYAIVNGPAHGGVGSINQLTGAISYVSQPGFSGTDTFTYVATDSGGTSQPATVTITVPPAPPTCAATAATTPAGGGAVAVKLSCTGPAGIGIQYGIVAGPAHGTLSALNQAAGSVVYTPSPGFHGSDSFTYDASDGGGASAPATASLTVAPGPPICADISSSTAGEGRAITVDLSCNGPSDTALHYAIASRPGHGTLGAINQARHSVRYTPRAGFHGSDHFTYTASDPGGTSNRATATITVPKPGGTLAFALLGWNFTPLSSGSQVQSMTATGLPVGTHIAASCAGDACHFKMAPVTVTSSTTCPGKKRCKRKSRPNTHSIDLTPKLRAVHFPVGSNLTVTFSKRGFIGKAYIFTMRSNRQPAWRATCLAPGSLVPGKGC